MNRAHMQFQRWSRLSAVSLVAAVIGCLGSTPVFGVSGGTSASLAIAALESASEFKEVEAVCIGGTPVSLSTRLKRLESVEVKTQDQSYEALTKQGITKAQVSPGDAAVLRKAAEAAGVDYLLAGSLTSTGNLREPGTKVRIAMKLFTTASGEVKEAGEVEGTAGDLSGLQAKLAGQVLQALQARGVSVGAAEQADILHEENVPLEAYLSFSEGNRLYFEGKYAEAEKLFWEAYQKSGGAFHAALAQYEKAGEKALTKRKEQGEDVSLDRKKRREILKKLDEEQTERLATVKFVRAEFSRWEAGLVEKEGNKGEARKLYEEALGYYEAFLANTRHQLLKWKTQIGLPKGFASSSPAVRNGRLFVGSTDGHVYALETSTGGVVWKYRPDGFTGAVHWSPIADEERVYVGIERALYALDIRTGRPRWRFYPQGSMCAYAVSDNRVLLTSTDARLYCIDDRTGVEEWQFELAQGGFAPGLAAGAGRVYAGDASGNVCALELGSGKKQWSLSLGSRALFDEASLSDGRLCAARENKGVYAIETESGTVRWHWPSDQAVGPPAAGKQSVFVSSPNQRLYAIDQETGRTRWEVAAKLWMRLPPAIEDGRVYFGTSEGHAYVVDGQTGKVLAALEAGREIATVPTALGDTLYVHALDGRVCAFNLAATGGQPVDVDAWCGLARAQAALGNYNKAQQAYSAVLDRRPGYDVNLYAELAECWRHLGNAGHEMKAWTSWLSRVEEQPAQGMRAVRRLRDLMGLKWVRRVSGVQLGPRSILDGQLYVGSTEGITALDAETGAVTWQHPTGAGVSWPPIAASGAVCVQVGERELRLLEVRTGKLQWRTELPMMPLFKADMKWVYELCFDGRSVGFASSEEDKAEVTVLDAATGERRWSARRGPEYLYLGVAEHHVFAAEEQGGVRAYDASTGRELWSAEVGRRALTMADGDTVYCFPYDQPCVALDRKTGQRRWHSLVVPRFWWFRYDDIALPHGDRLYVGDMRGSVDAGDATGTLHCLDKNTGAEKWVFETPNYVECTPAWDNDTVYFTSKDAWLRAVDAQTGRLRWALPDCGGSHINPLRHRDSLIVTAGGNLLWSLDLRRVEKLVADGVRWWEPDWREPLSYARSAKDTEEKKKHLAAAQALAQDDPTGLGRVAQVWLELGDFRRAAQISERGRTLSPENAEANAAWRKANLIARSLDAVEKNPNDMECHLLLADSYASYGLHEDADRAYRAAAERWRDDPKLHLKYADYLRGRERFDEASAEYRVAFERSPGMVGDNYVDVLVKQNRPEEALQVALRGIAAVGRAGTKGHALVAPPIGVVMSQREEVPAVCRAYQACGRKGDALKEYLHFFAWLGDNIRNQYQEKPAGKAFAALLDELQKEGEQNGELLRQVAYGNLLLGRLDLARSQAGVLTKLRPDDPDAATVSAWVSWRKGSHAEAISTLQTVVAASPERLEAAFTLAAWLTGRDRRAEAVELLSSIAARGAGEFEVLGRVGRLLAEAGDYAGARRQADKLEALMPGSSASSWLRDQVALRQGKPPERHERRKLFMEIGQKTLSLYQVALAEEQLGRALADDPDNGMLHYLQATLRVIEGRWSEAVEAWQKGTAATKLETYMLEQGATRFMTLIPHLAMFRFGVREFAAHAAAMEPEVAVAGLQAARQMGVRLFAADDAPMLSALGGIALMAIADNAAGKLLEGKPEYRAFHEQAKQQYDRDLVWSMKAKAECIRLVDTFDERLLFPMVKRHAELYADAGKHVELLPAPSALHEAMPPPEVLAQFDATVDAALAEERALSRRLAQEVPAPEPLVETLRGLQKG